MDYKVYKAKIIDGFMVDGEKRFDVWVVFDGPPPIYKFNEEEGRYEIKAEDINYLIIECDIYLVGVEFDKNE